MIVFLVSYAVPFLTQFLVTLRIPDSYGAEITKNRPPDTFYF